MFPVQVIGVLVHLTTGITEHFNKYWSVKFLLQGWYVVCVLIKKLPKKKKITIKGNHKQKFQVSIGLCCDRCK